jgi:hypothetical protein
LRGHAKSDVAAAHVSTALALLPSVLAPDTSLKCHPCSDGHHRVIDWQAVDVTRRACRALSLKKTTRLASFCIVPCQHSGRTWHAQFVRRTLLQLMIQVPRPFVMKQAFASVGPAASMSKPCDTL